MLKLRNGASIGQDRTAIGQDISGLLTEADRPLALDFLSAKRTATASELARKAGRPLEVITDRNLVTEYRYGR